MSAKKDPEFKIWYRTQFLNSVCHICKIVPDKNGRTCPHCSLVLYCSPDHCEEDIDDHEDICNALKTSATVLGSLLAHEKAQFLNPEQWREFRLGLTRLCSKNLGRQLFPWELEICLFPPVCATCYKISNKLEICPECSYGRWCSLEHKPKNHSEFCSGLNLFKDVLQKQIHVIPSPKCSFIPKHITELARDPQFKDDTVKFCLLTEVATSPLTIIRYLPKITDAFVHIVGPEPHFEANNLAKWETFLFDVCPEVKNLTLDFVGPEIGPFPSRKISKNDRTLQFNFHQLLYHDFAGSNLFHPPTLICALNPGLYRPQGFDGKDSWAPTIDAMFKHQSVPVLVTSYTNKEALLDYARIKKQVPSVKTLEKPGPNPFSSLRPLMNFVSDECSPIVFKNAFLSVLQA